MFLSEPWMDATNQVLGRDDRPVVPPVQDPRLRVSTDGAEFDLVLVGRAPRIEPPSGTPTASVTLRRRILERAFLNGSFQLCAAGAQNPEGSRETLLYFLYHTYPGGPAGAREMADEVRGHTAA
jgi:hypothetical protein